MAKNRKAKAPRPVPGHLRAFIARLKARPGATAPRLKRRQDAAAAPMQPRAAGPAVASGAARREAAPPTVKPIKPRHAGLKARRGAARKRKAAPVRCVDLMRGRLAGQPVAPARSSAADLMRRRLTPRDARAEAPPAGASG